MKQKSSLFIAGFLIGFLFGGGLYFFNVINTTQEFLMYSVSFGASVFFFELYVRPTINKLFKKPN